MKRTTLSIAAFGISILSIICLAFITPSGSANPVLNLISPYSGTWPNTQQPFFPEGNQTESHGFHNQVCTTAISIFIPEEAHVHFSQHGIPNIPANGRYYWLAGLLNEYESLGGQRDWNSGVLAKILQPTPAAPIPLSPTALSFTNDQTPTFSWGSVPYGNSYDFEISTDASFANLVSSTRVEASAKKQIDLTLTEPLTPDGWYHWRVRANNTDGIFGAWSIAIKFAVDTNPPPKPVLNLPVENAATLSTPLFTWQSSVWANAYQFEYATDRNFPDDSIRHTSKILMVARYTPPSMPFGTPCYWHVRARDAAGNWSSWSEPRRVTLAASVISNFEGLTSGWTPQAGGKWSIYKNAYFFSSGAAGKWSSARFESTLNQLDFSARVLRSGGVLDTEGKAYYPASYLAVRMGDKLGDNNAWLAGYLFGYTNQGVFSIWKINSDGSARVMQPWTETSLLAINDWNTLRVAASDSALNFYINGILAWTGSDGGFKDGKVGFSFFNHANPSSIFFVDWASLSELKTFPAIDSIPARQAELNHSAWQNSRGQSPAYSQGEVMTPTPTPTPLPTNTPTPLPLPTAQPTPTPVITPTPENTPTHQATPTAEQTATPTILIPAKVSLISPQGIIKSALPVYRWEAIRDGQEYLLRISNSDANTILEKWLSAKDVCGKDYCESMPSLTLTADNYTWRVMARNPAGEGEWSEPLDFTVSAPPNPPGAATPVSPSGSLPNKLNTPIFAWSGVHEASAYRLAIRRADGTPIFEQWAGADEACSGIKCQVTPALSLAPGEYQWLVQTRNDGGNGPESNPLIFSILP